MTEPYRVNHHLIQMLYFETNDSLPRCSEYARLWSGLQLLGNRSVSGDFCDATIPSRSRIRRLKLGSLEVFKSLLAEPDSLIAGGGAEQRKDADRPGCDLDFYIHLHPESRCASGFTPPNFQLAVSDNWRRQIAHNSLLQVLRNNFEILDSRSPFYGFIDIDRPEETFPGLMYTALGCGNAPLSRFVDRAQWLRSVALKREQARSIYWGNYFGPRLLQKLGGRSAFLDAYVEDETAAHPC